MHQESAPIIQLEPEVFAAPVHHPHPSAYELSRRTTQRPTQRFTQAHASDRCAFDMRLHTSASDFNFGQFGHGAIMAICHTRRMRAWRMRRLTKASAQPWRNALCGGGRSA
jgi:hypothetical protein